MQIEQIKVKVRIPCRILSRTFRVFTLGDARSFSGLTSKIPPLGSVLKFDTDVKKTTARQQCKNPNCTPCYAPKLDTNRRYSCLGP